MDLYEWVSFFYTSWGLPFTLYLILQIGAVLHFRNRKLNSILYPIPIMLLAVFITVILYHKNSRLWPIYLIYVSLIAAIYILICWIKRGRAEGKSKPLKYWCIRIVASFSIMVSFGAAAICGTEYGLWTGLGTFVFLMIVGVYLFKAADEIEKNSASNL
ncbi:MAG: hypothetical protein JW914_00500 [Syntrophaceae bacterium]|nr:hypothetical protein [Syntrophaceae bacterium]